MIFPFRRGLALVIVTGLATTLLPGQPLSGSAHTSIESRIDRTAKQSVQEYNIPGMTVAITRNGRLVVNKAYGYADYTEKVPMQPYHRSPIGSVSKIITVIAVMKLTEENSSFAHDQLLFGSEGALNDPGYIASFIEGSRRYERPEWIEWYEEMRVNHLLSHTAGVERNDGNTNNIRDYFGIPHGERIPEDMLVRYHLIHKRLIFPPGDSAEYSNIGMGTFMKAIVLANSGLLYGHYVDRNILRPLGLHGDVVNYNHYRDKYDSYIHSSDGGIILTKPWSADYNRDLDRVGAAGGWAASARSLVRLIVAVDGHENYPDILTENTIDIMEQRPYPEVSSTALGWQWSAQGRRLEHNGSGAGGKAQLIRFKEGYSLRGSDLSDINIAICVNYDGIPLSELKALAERLAIIVGQSDIPQGYDLFPSTDPPAPDELLLQREIRSNRE